MSLRRAALASVFSLVTVSAFAQSSSNYPMYAQAQNSASAPVVTTANPAAGQDMFGLPDGTFSGGVKFGTLGIGGEVGYRPFSMFGVRLDGEAFSFSDDFDAGRTRYHATAELQSYGALADLYPFGESFRITGGLRLNENQLRGNATDIQTSIADSGSMFLSTISANWVPRLRSTSCRRISASAGAVPSPPASTSPPISA